MKIALLVAALLIVPSSAPAAVLWFTGCETGNETDEVFNVVNAGSLDCATNSIGVTPPTGAYQYYVFANNVTFTSSTGYGLTTLFARTNYMSKVDSATTNVAVMLLANAGTTHFDAIYWRSDVKHFAYSFDGGAFVVTGATTINLGTYYLLDVKCVISATVGGCELKVNGVTEFSSFATNNSAISTYDHVRFGANSGAGSIEQLYDNLMACSTSYCPAGVTIARQGASGTPTYNAWTKVGVGCSGSSIDNCWSNTPFTTNTSATSAVASDAQTMIVSPFGSTQTGHGSETIGSHDTINACKTALIAKTAVSSGISIRRRLNGTDTDTAKTLTTSDAYYDDGIWTTTAATLRGATMEIGAIHGTGVNLDTVEDAWLICDYLASTTPTRHRVTQ